MEKSELSLSTYVQYVENFRFWMNVGGRVYRLPENETIEKSFLNGFKPLCKEMYSRTFETLGNVIREARARRMIFLPRYFGNIRLN